MPLLPVPNTLVHFAAQGVASRAVWRPLDARWVYLGCLLPDLPWILRRVLVALQLPVDSFDLRLYTMAQASLAGTLLLCAALALASVAPRVVFPMLSLNALLHLLLDASEIKWGNGVHLLAPFSWRMTSFGLFSGDGTIVLALTAAGGLLMAWELVRRRMASVDLDLRPRRLAAAASLCLAYFLAPLPFLPAIEATDSYSVKTLREVSRRPGRAVSLDRTAFLSTPDGGVLEVWTGERLRATGVTPGHDARVSLRGTFLSPDLLRIDSLVEHRESRDWPSYIALAMLVLLWIRPQTDRMLRVAGRLWSRSQPRA
jgi:hypothetical protein